MKLVEWLRQFGLYGRSLVFFLVLGGGLLLVANTNVFSPLGAIDPAGGDTQDASAYDLEFYLYEDGQLYLGRQRLKSEIFTDERLYRLRYQAINRPEEFLEELTIAVYLPRPGSEEIIGHRFINNGGALLVESGLVDEQTVVYTAYQVGTDAQLAIELEVPRSFIANTALVVFKERLSQISPEVWVIVSLALPALTFLILFLVSISRNRRPSAKGVPEYQEPPSKLLPAMLGILLRGRVTSRELAATLIDLARRGHLVIRQLSADDFRFRRRNSNDKLEPFEEELLAQIFGPASDKAQWEEISLSLSQEVFSQRISRAFLLLYQRISELGYFYTNPLALHRRYQAVGITLFFLALAGFFINLFIFDDLRFLLFLWLGGMLAAVLIARFSRSLPVRTIYGDRELARWLGFAKFLSSKEPINYAAHAQDKYLAYLGYAIVFDLEVDWTNRFLDSPFTQPGWYIAPQVGTVDQFANKVFPMFGYLSHVLAISAAPSSR